jgi:tripartite-type tricarboxylate transporter receptor subunit TctC
MDRRSFLQAISGLVAGASINAAAASADEKYPARAFRYIVPYNAGGPADTVARIQAEFLTRKFGQGVVVDNTPGGLGIAAARALAASAPDGYTLMFQTSSQMLIAPKLGIGRNFGDLKQIVPVSLTWSQPNLLLVRKQSPFRSIEELVAQAKLAAKPPTFGSSGVNTAQHLCGEVFARMAGIKLTHVPYSGVSQYMADILEGRIDMAFGTPPTLMANPDSIKALMVLAARRFSLTPDVPTSAEAGFAGLDVPSWGAMMTRRDTPEPIIAALDAACGEMEKDETTRGKIVALGIEPEHVGTAQFGERIRKESDILDQLIAKAGLRVQ